MIHNTHLGPMDEFIAASINLVHHVVKPYKNAAKGHGLDYDDLFQTGCIGLIKAYTRFDPKFGTKFSTYAVPTIRGPIQQLLRDTNLLSSSSKDREIAGRIYREGLEDESAEVIAASLACSLRQARRGLAFQKTVVVSADIPLKPLLDRLPDHDDLTRVEVDEFLIRLPTKFATVVRLRMEGKTQAEIARKMGVSQAQISRYGLKIGKRYLEEVM